jgi:uncharacterized C2H2 Zn-finger protein
MAASALALLLIVPLGAAAQDSPRPLLKKYIGNPDTDALLKEPAVRARLDAMVGKQMPQLLRSLDVRSDVELIGGALVLSGNAPHQGGQEEGIVCIADQGPTPQVEAAIYLKGKVTVFAKAPQYEYLMRCIKDWITQVNSSHRDRFTQPKNVQVIAKP